MPNIVAEQKSVNINSDNKNAATANQSDSSRVQNKFIDLKFGKKYKLNEDN